MNHKPHFKKVDGRWGVCAYRLNRFNKPTHPLYWGATVDEAWEKYRDANIAFFMRQDRDAKSNYLGRKRRAQ